MKVFLVCFVLLFFFFKAIFCHSMILNKYYINSVLTILQNHSVGFVHSPVSVKFKHCQNLFLHGTVFHIRPEISMSLSLSPPQNVVARIAQKKLNSRRREDDCIGMGMVTKKTVI